MNKSTAILSAALLAGVSSVSAQDAKIVVRSESGNDEAYALTEATMLSVTSAGVSVDKGAVIGWDKVARISFLTPTGVEGVAADAQAWRIAENPVGDRLVVEGHDGSAAHLSICSLGGAVVMASDSWKGESLDVSGLASGIYILNINSKSAKFIKK